MGKDFIGACIAFICGVGISVANYFIAKLLINKSKILTSLIRQALYIVFLILIYFTSPFLPWSLSSLLIGGALGLTAPLIYFTYKLIKR